MNREEKRNIRLKICNLLDNHCSNCEYRRGSQTHVYCSNECQVGKSLLGYSKMLTGSEGTTEPIIIHPISPVVPKTESLKTGHWTKEEEFYLLNHIKLFSQIHLAKKLNRTLGSVSAKLSKLKKQHPELSVSK